VLDLHSRYNRFISQRSTPKHGFQEPREVAALIRAWYKDGACAICRGTLLGVGCLTRGEADGKSIVSKVRAVATAIGSLASKMKPSKKRSLLEGFWMTQIGMASLAPKT
jgi:hypothetical protein